MTFIANLKGGKQVARKKPKTESTGMFGMWSVRQKRFIFGIQEPSKNRARNALEKEIGRYNSYYFKVREIVEGHAESMLKNGLGKELKRK